jgi:hypothetical protein
MNDLRRAADEYLALRRALGFKLRGHDRLLADFLDHLERSGTTTITVATAVAWATALADVTPIRCGNVKSNWPHRDGLSWPHLLTRFIGSRHH